MSITVVRQTPPNARAAVQNRAIFDELGIACLHLNGAAGAGKTSLLEAVLPRLRTQMRIGVVEGDQTGMCDAQRIEACGVPVVQVLTDGACRLSAAQVQRGMAELPLREMDLLIVEDVGGPGCEPAVDLGAHLKAAVLSISGGHHAAYKYPRMLADAGLILLTKYDLLPSVQFDLEGTLRHLRNLSPLAEIICTDVRNRIGVDRVAGWILGYVRAQHMRRMRRARSALAQAVLVQA